MQRKSTIIIVLQTVLIVILVWLLVFFGKDEYEAETRDKDDKIASASQVSLDEGVATVTLSAESQEQSGITTSLLKPAPHLVSLPSFARVLALDGLVDLRGRYLTARADADAARAALAHSRQEHERLLVLSQEDHAVSARAVGMAEAAWQADVAKLAAAEAATAAAEALLRQQWGATLAGWATQSPSPPGLQALLERRELLVQISLPAGSAAPDKAAALFLEVGGKPLKAAFVSASPLGDALQGASYFYRAPAGSLRVGMALPARLAPQKKAALGVVVPKTAVLWYANKAWVYKKTAAEQFVRQEISTETEAGEGWFIAAGLKPGDEVITSGAQLLLSEEFKYQIKNENED